MGTTRTTRVRDRDSETIEAKLVAALRRRREATIADLVTDTALPKIRVEEGMRTVLNEYVGHLKATESGELLYSFPTGMRNRVRGLGPSLRRGLRAVGRGALKTMGFLFRVWIAVMLVGYFSLFVALFVLAIVASIAASMAGRQGEQRTRSRGGGLGGFYLVGRIIDLLFIRVLLSSGARKDKGERGRPLHRSVFAFVFGEKDTEAAWAERERQVVLRHLRANRGVITVEELIRITGRNRDEAERYVTDLLVEYEGEPQVTERGTVVYFFPELLRTRTEALETQERAILPPKPLVPFNDNKPKTNRWIAFFNTFNTVLGGYFTGYSLAVAAGARPAGFFLFVGGLIGKYLQVNPLPILGIGLGLVPLAFSVIFFLVPLARRALTERRNEKIRQENTRRDVYGTLLARPQEVRAEALVREAKEHADALAGRALRTGPQRRVRSLPRNLGAFVKSEVDRLAADKHAEVEQGPDGGLVYRFGELEQEQADVEKHRAGVDLRRYEVGKTVFDSSE